MPDINRLLEQSDAGFKRYTGIQKTTFKAMLEAMQKYEAAKTKSGHPSELSLEAQLLLVLTYWREYRTLYHIGMDFGIHESSVSRMVRKVEDILIKSDQFDLPKNLPRDNSDNVNWSTVIIDATETPIERPKKPKRILQWKKKATHLKSASHCALADGFNTRRSKAQCMTLVFTSRPVLIGYLRTPAT